MCAPMRPQKASRRKIRQRPTRQTPAQELSTKCMLLVGFSYPHTYTAITTAVLVAHTLCSHDCVLSSYSLRIYIIQRRWQYKCAGILVHVLCRNFLPLLIQITLAFLIAAVKNHFLSCYS